MFMDNSGLAYTDEEKHLFSLMTGFMKTRILTVALDYDLFSFIAPHGKNHQEIATYLSLTERSLQVFLEALVNMKLIIINKRNNYQNTGTAAKYLVKGKLSFLGDTVDLLASQYRCCDSLKKVLRENQPQSQKYSYFFSPNVRGLTRTEVEKYAAEMDATSSHPAMILSEFHDFQDSRVLLDIGGGTGKLCRDLVSQYPHLETIMYDLPAICAIAEKELKEFWLGHRIRLYPGDFFNDPFPTGFDTAVLMRIIQDWPDRKVRFLFEKIYKALPKGGKLIIYEILKNETPHDPGDAALISFYLTLISPGGRCRTGKEMKGLLEETGFTGIECIDTIYFYKAVIAVKE
ncbi:MAG: methyltransferase domain-containing protein [bacterium]|nr:methyltransferase domain-containing protein [bacterium]